MSNSNGTALHFHAATNRLPGYLSDDLLAVFPNWFEAKAYVIHELLNDADSAASWNEPHDCDDVPCPTYGDDCPEGKASDLTFVAEELNLSNGPDWSTITAGLSYWIHECGCPAGQAELAHSGPDQVGLVQVHGQACTCQLCESPEVPAKSDAPWTKTPNMTRGQFAYIARIVAGMDFLADMGMPNGAGTVKRYVAEELAHHLYDTNVRFDHDRFIAACTA